MIGLLQRVRSAYVQVDGQQIASIEQGVLALVGIQREDRQAQADRLLDRMLGYRLLLVRMVLRVPFGNTGSTVISMNPVKTIPWEALS